MRLSAAALCSALAFLAPGMSMRARIEAASPDFDRLALQQAQTDRAWRLASSGRMSIEKITFPSRAGGLSIPAFVFQPLASGTAGSRPALVISVDAFNQV